MKNYAQVYVKNSFEAAQHRDESSDAKHILLYL